LFAEFVRLLEHAQPKFFLVENVPGLARRRGGRLLREQLTALAGAGYNIAMRMVRAEGFGVPQRRRRIVAVGVRRDLGVHYWFPSETHGPDHDGQQPLRSGGDAICDLPLWPDGGFYEHPDPAHNFPWYFMSRNRKARWEEPGRTVLASWRHVSLHPASPVMEYVCRDPLDKNRQTWRFSQSHDHLDANPTRPALERPRRLSARECARLQDLPDSLKLAPDIRVAFRHIGNAVPPALAEAILTPLVSGSALRDAASTDHVAIEALPATGPVA
jgi:DNA (cytosine-5)-methyltransferase 1